MLLRRALAMACVTGWIGWGCASAPPAPAGTGPVAEETPPPRRHHRRHRTTEASASPAPGDTTAPVEGTSTASGALGALTVPPSTASGDATAPPAGGSSFGTPTVASRAEQLTPEWSEEEGRARIVCAGAELHAAPHCPQCPDEPSNASLVRSFLPVERASLDCNPPSNREGRLPIRATFNAAGYPTEFRFPGVNLERDTGVCLGRALCRVRVPTFRTPEATVDYDYVVMLPDNPR